jgi:prepilin-type N-terminal cleavage/methylation domain-containing protein
MQPGRSYRRSGPAATSTVAASPSGAGFTLTELLIVIGIIALLAAIIFPVFVQVRARSHETTCTANLRQIGMASLMYSQDYDNEFPYAGDPLDCNASYLWEQSGPDDKAHASEVTTLRPLTEVLEPYIKEKRLWGCPADSGFTYGGRGEQWPFDTRPSSYERFGSSYYYYTRMALEHKPLSDLRAWDTEAPYAERGPANIVFLYDGTGIWHGGTVFNTRRYGSLFADGHAKTLLRNDFDTAFRITFTQPH